MENSSKKELRKLVRKLISESAEPSFMNIASTIKKNIPEFVEILDLHYVTDGIYVEYMHEDGKAFQFLIKEKKPKEEETMDSSEEIKNPDINAIKHLSKGDINLNEENNN